LVMENSGIIDDSIFADNVTLKFHIPVDSVNSLNKALSEATCGEIETEVLSENYYEM